MNLFKIKFIKDHWKEGVHLLFRTKRFGVNNNFYSEFDSLFGWPTRKIFTSIILIYPIILNYRMMKFRAAGCHFLTEDTNKKLGWHRYWDKGDKND